MSAGKVYSLSDFSTSKTETIPQKSFPKSTEHNSNDIIYVDMNEYIDVDRIHSHIVGLFNTTMNNLQYMQEELDELMEVEATDEADQYLLDSQISAMMESIEKLYQEIQHKSKYPDEAMDLIKTYKSKFGNNRSRIIGSSDSTIPVEDWDIFRLLSSRFIDIARKFTNAIVVKEDINVPMCTKCSNTTIMQNGNAFCPNCNITIKLKDSETSETNAGLGYQQDHSCTETVEEAMQCLMGISRKPIPAKVYQIIEEHCKRYDIDVKKLSKPDIIGLLKLKKLADYYKSFNLIANVLTGVPLPKVRKYRKAVTSRCRLIEREYAIIKHEENRSNFMFAWYVLRACLVMEGYKANSDDFLTLTTRGAAIEHDRIMKKVCFRIRESLTDKELEETNWNFNGLA